MTTTQGVALGYRLEVLMGLFQVDSNKNLGNYNTIMFTAKVYKICIASASGAMKEERVAQDTVIRWNCQNGEGRGVISSGSARSALVYLYFL